MQRLAWKIVSPAREKCLQLLRFCLKKIIMPDTYLLIQREYVVFRESNASWFTYSFAPFSKIFFQEYHQSVKHLQDPDQAWCRVGPDLGPNCLQRLSADDTSRQRLNRFKSSVLFMGHRQTVQNQTRLGRMLCLIRFFTICFQNVLLKFEWNLLPNSP